MYFWRIEKLKTEMATRPLSERETLPYLIVTVAIASIPAGNDGGWQVFDAIVAVVLEVLGAIYIFRQNGGATGQHFLQRYFAVGWVVSLRCVPAAVVAAGVCVVAMASTVGISDENTQWPLFLILFRVVVWTGFYWRIGHHVRDLAVRTTTV